MRFILTLILVFVTSSKAFPQLMFVERIEVETGFSDNDFMVIPRTDGLIAFRTQPENGFNFKSTLQYFLTDFELKSDIFKEIPIRDNYDLVSYDLEGDYFYALLQKGTSLISHRYIIEINLNDDIATEIALENIYSMELKEFFVLNRNAVFMGTTESRPIVQIYDINASNVITVQGIYSKETNIIQLRKDSELGILDILVSRRDKYKMKQLSLFTFDEKGNKIREVAIGQLEDPNWELVEGILTPIQNYQQSILGTFGQKRREAYQGIYLTDINEFGEYSIRYFTLEDFPNFYNYLNEKQRIKKWLNLDRSIAKGKAPSIKPVLSSREVHSTDQGFLVYSDNFLATNPRYIQRDGVYANDAYRYNPYRMNPFQFDGFPSNLGSRYGTSSLQTEGEYKFQSAYFLYLSRDGQVIWENAFNLNNKISFMPGKYGEVSFDGEKLHYIYLEGTKIYLSYLKNGEIIFENLPYEIELINEKERIKDTQDGSLSLSSWYLNYYFLSGKQRVRYQDEEGKEKVREVFFITKIKLDGDLYVPEDEF